MNLNKMDWLRELSKEELEEVLFGDLRLIYMLCGVDALVKICENLMGLNLYISSKPIKDAMKVYVKKNFKGYNHKELAITLGVSERYIYKVLREEDNDRDKNR